jgi:hypothetical protein
LFSSNSQKMASFEFKLEIVHQLEADTSLQATRVSYKRYCS